MDILDIYKTLGLTDKEIKSLTNQIFETKLELANNLSDEHQYLLNKKLHQAEVQNYLKNFTELEFSEDDIMHQTVEIVYAKIMFLASIGIEINNQNKKYILLDEDKFYHTFGITYEELTNLYPYKEYEENINKR